ncbi:hypothetical protein [Sodalis-like endosymbiont of Proechinophthirus fluctus]|uniref:hypothetical protein n=1 Tax=Sodalis-like endosymbiont of Proechinophthirus fluctus TaxID=1462730 RepID=UPI000B101BD8|nr:hypothetical protein [Sodalis-like endosymbiont of Proechinophthirus fluctus]
MLRALQEKIYDKADEDIFKVHEYQYDSLSSITPGISLAERVSTILLATCGELQ